MTESRVPAGVPAGGQFAASTRAESGVALAERPISDLMVGKPVHTFSRPGLACIDVMPDGADGFTAYPTIEDDVSDGLAQYLCKSQGWDPAGPEYDTAHEAATAWLSEHGGQIFDEHLAEQYNATNDDTRDWDMPQRIYCEFRIQPTDTEDDIAAAVHRATSADELAEDIASGEIYNELMAEAAHRHPSFDGGYVDDARTRQMIRAQVARVLTAGDDQ